MAHAEIRCRTSIALVCGVLAGSIYILAASPARTCAPCTEPKHQQASGTDVLPAVAKLPRPKTLWSIPGVIDVSLAGSSPGSANLFVARDEDTNAVVAFDPKTGKQRWRAQPRDLVELNVIGNHVLAYDLFENHLSSYAAATGALEWEHAQICAAPYHTGRLHLSGDGIVAAGSCILQTSGPQPPLGEIVMGEPTAEALGLDVASGNVLWRHRLAAHKTVAQSDGRTVVFVNSTKRIQDEVATTISCVDARTGKQRWSTQVPHEVFGLGLGPGFVLAVGMKVDALDSRDGRLMWKRTVAKTPCEAPLPHALWEGFTPDMLDGLLLWPDHGALLGLEPASGKEARRWVLPTSSVIDNEIHAVHVAGHRIVITMGMLAPERALVVVDGNDRTVLAASALDDELGTVGDILVASQRRQRGLVGVSLRETIGDETSLSPAERVHAVLEHVVVYTRGRSLPAEYESALKVVPGYESLLIAIAMDRKSKHRHDAVAVIGALRIAKGASIVKAILDEEVPPEMPWPQPETAQVAKPRSPAEFPAYRQAWERARRERPSDEYYRARAAHDEALELRRLAEEALRRLGDRRER